MAINRQCVARLICLGALSGFAGCGVAVPDIKEPWDGDIPGAPAAKLGDMPRAPIAGAGQIEFEIKKQVYCELRRAVISANKYFVQKAEKSEKPTPLLPKDWGALVSISLEVDESAALNPGVALNNPMANAVSTFGVMNTVSTPQIFSLGLGGTLSSTATRTDKLDPYYRVDDLSTPIKDESVCNEINPQNGKVTDPFEKFGYHPAKSSPLIRSELGLEPWLLGALFTNNALPSVVGPKAPTKRELDEDREKLNKKGYNRNEITQIIASGANYDDTAVLERSGYSHAQIARYLDLGASPLDLVAKKKQGYDPAEIESIVKKKAKEVKAQSSSSGGGTTPPDTISIEIKFVIVSSASVTPTWKLVRVSANTGTTPLLGIGRTRTHDLIITIGPPNAATANTHLASQIGNAVGSAARLNAISNE